MTLAPLWLLDGGVTLIKTVKVEGGTEKHYQDEHGSQAVVFVPDKKESENGRQ